MNDLKEGVELETGVVLDETWLICGFCMELICKKEEICPEKCPHCGMKIKKGVEK